MQLHQMRTFKLPRIGTIIRRTLQTSIRCFLVFFFYNISLITLTLHDQSWALNVYLQGTSPTEPAPGTKNSFYSKIQCQNRCMCPGDGDVTSLGKTCTSYTDCPLGKICCKCARCGHRCVDPRNPCFKKMFLGNCPTTPPTSSFYKTPTGQCHHYYSGSCYPHSSACAYCCGHSFVSSGGHEIVNDGKKKG